MCSGDCSTEYRCPRLTWPCSRRPKRSVCTTCTCKDCMYLTLSHLAGSPNCVPPRPQESHGLHHHDLYPLQHGRTHPPNSGRRQPQNTTHFVSLWLLSSLLKVRLLYIITFGCQANNTIIIQLRAVQGRGSSLLKVRLPEEYVYLWLSGKLEIAGNNSTIQPRAGGLYSPCAQRLPLSASWRAHTCSWSCRASLGILCPRHGTRQGIQPRSSPGPVQVQP